VLGQLGDLGKDAIGEDRQLHFTIVARAPCQAAPHLAEVVVELPAPSRDVDRQGPALLARQQGVPAVLGGGLGGGFGGGFGGGLGGRLAEDLVHDLEHLFGAHRHRVDLVRDSRELVPLVRDDVAEVGVVGRPTQQEIVVRDHEVRLRERLATPTKRAAGGLRAVLATALLRPGRDGLAEQVAQAGVATQQGGGQRADLAVGAGARAAHQHRVGEALFFEDPQLAALGEHGFEPTLAHVVRPALDRHGAQLGMAEEARRRRNVLAQQLILQELRAGRDHDRPRQPPCRLLQREGDRGGEVGEGLPDAGATFEEQGSAPGEVARKVPCQIHLLFAHAIAREIARAPLLVAQHPRNGVFVEGDREILAGRDGDELLGLLGGRHGKPLAEELTPGRIGRVALEGAAGHDVARLARGGTLGDPGEHPRRIEGVVQGPMTLLAGEQHPGKGLETQIRSVGVGEGEQVLGVEIARVGELARHEAAQELALEIGVVGHDDAALEDAGHEMGDLLEARRVRDVVIVQAGETLDGRRKRSRRLHQGLQGARFDPRPGSVEEKHTELENLGASIRGQPRGLEIHDGEGAPGCHQGAEPLGLESQLLAPARLDFECAGFARRRSRP